MNVQGVFAGGGWLNRPTEAERFTAQAFNQLNGPIQGLILPTPTSEPCDEVDQLREALSTRSDVTISTLGANQVWPDPADLLEALDSANFVAIPGGNFPDYMSLVAGAVGEALKRKLLSGAAVFVGSSCGTVSWFDFVHTADRPSSEGGDTLDYYRLEPGLGALPGYVCAHYNERNEHSGLSRSHLFQEMMRVQPTGSIGFGVDTQAALVMDKGKLRCATRDRYAHVQIIKTREDGNLEMTRLRDGKGDLSIEELYAA